MKALLLGAMLAAGLSFPASAGQCEKGDEITFSFSNLEVKAAFAIIADAAGLKPRIDSSINASEAMRFTCMSWRVIAEDLARRHNLRLKIEGGVLQVSRQ
jgi:hypothetical protein